MSPSPFCVAPKRLKPFGSYAELSPSCVARGARLCHRRNVVQPRAKQGLSCVAPTGRSRACPKAKQESSRVRLPHPLGVPSRQRYIGITTDLKRRIDEHNRGKTRSTRAYCPWEVAVAIYFTDPAKAQAFERYLKHGSGHVLVQRDVEFRG